MIRHVLMPAALVASLSLFAAPAFAQHGGRTRGTTVSRGSARVATRPVYNRPTYSRPIYSRPIYSRPIYSRQIYTRPYYSRPIYVAPTRFYRPYYSFRPRFSIGFGLWVGYPVAYSYPYYYGYPYGYDPYYAPYDRYYPPYPSYAPPAYGYPAPYSNYPSSNYPSSNYPSSNYPSSGYQTPPAYADQNAQQNTMIAQPGAAAGSISFEITPSNAAVIIDGTYVGRVSDLGPTAQPMGLKPGRHHVEVRASGYQTISFDADVVAGQVLPYRGQMQPQ